MPIVGELSHQVDLRMVNVNYNRLLRVYWEQKDLHCGWTGICISLFFDAPRGRGD